MKLNIVFTIIIIFIAFSCKNKQASKINDDDYYDTNSPSWMVYGMISPNEFQEEDAAKLLGFEWKRIAGCMTPESTIQHAIENNKITDSILKIRIGTDWKIKHEKLADSLYNIDNVAQNIVITYLQSKNFIEALKDSNSNIIYRVFRTRFNNIVVVQGYDYKLENRVFRQYEYFRVALDITKNKVLTIDTIGIIN